MAHDFKFPDVGEGVTEGILIKWLVKEGEKVTLDQPLAEIETDKAVVEVPSPEAGVILHLPWKDGDTIDVGKTLCVIGKEGEKYDAAAPAPPEPVAEEDEDAASVVGNVKGDKPIELPSVGMQTKPTAPSTGAVKVLPKVRKLARELGVSLSNLNGTGKNGQITEDDIRAAQSGTPTSTPAQQSHSVTPAAEPSIDFSKYGDVNEVPLTGIRKAIAHHMQKSVRTAPHAVAMEEVDVTELWAVRKKEKVRAENRGIKLTFLPFIVKAIVAGLKKHPNLNASLDEQKQAIMQKQYYNIGIAVDSEHGLMVPVIKNADEKSILEIAKEIVELAEKVRDRKIKPDEMAGGSFTLTNYGSIAGTFGVPVINYPEAAILGVGRIKDKPRMIGEGILSKQVLENRKILYLSLSFDHRIVDGADAARFLHDMIKNLEDPDNLLVDMD
jgi:pyruvate dehydrogenase E2 component (dihydrolipoamide acetyltransferase)